MRHIDRVIQAVQDDEGIPPVHKRLLISRIEQEPTPEELSRAKAQVYGIWATETPGIKPGDEVKIKGSDGQRWRGVVSDVVIATDPFGPPGEQVPGLTSTALTIEITSYGKRS